MKADVDMEAKETRRAAADCEDDAAAAEVVA